MHEFVNKAQSTIERELSFSSPESLAVELDQTRVCKMFLYLFSVASYLLLKVNYHCFFFKNPI